MRRCPGGQQVHQFRLHEGEVVWDVQTDEVFEGRMSGESGGAAIGAAGRP